MEALQGRTAKVTGAEPPVTQHFFTRIPCPERHHSRVTQRGLTAGSSAFHNFKCCENGRKMASPRKRCCLKGPLECHKRTISEALPPSPQGIWEDSSVGGLARSSWTCVPQLAKTYPHGGDAVHGRSRRVREGTCRWQTPCLPFTHWIFRQRSSSQPETRPGSHVCCTP